MYADAYKSVGVSEGPRESQHEVSESASLGCVAQTMPPVEYLRPRSRQSAKWGLEDYTAWNAQEKKLWVNTAIWLVYVRPSVYHTPQKLHPFSRKIVV